MHRKGPADMVFDDAYHHLRGSPKRLAYARGQTRLDSRIKKSVSPVFTRSFDGRKEQAN